MFWGFDSLFEYVDITEGIGRKGVRDGRQAEITPLICNQDQILVGHSAIELRAL